MQKTAMPRTSSRVRLLYRYPVKGLSGERLSSVELGAGETFPMDRAYALENGLSGFDPSAPSWQPKIKYLCLMKNARLAELSTHYDDESRKLTIKRGEKMLAACDLSAGAEHRAVEDFFDDFMGAEKRGPIRLLQASGHSFSDVASKVVSLINLTTLAELEARIGLPVHPVRFRANIYFDGLPAWSEHDLVGQTLEVGSARMKVVKRIARCAATEVNPETALRDIEIPAILNRSRGNLDLGVYAEVKTPGRFAEGDPVNILG
jgi:uncharacterized protein YcbX